jgi:triosephosphate isomerase
MIEGGYMRIPLIAGNWKMHKTNSQAVETVRELVVLLREVKDTETVICPPFTALSDVAAVIKETGSDLGLGAQNVYPRKEGAFTGEVSPSMLRELGVSYVIVGHSERREILGEKDDFVAAKVRAVLDHGMIPILCVGETLEEREEGKAESKVAGQLELDLADVKAEEADRLVIAYEPIWAIGTGRTATPEDAQEMNSLIREELSRRFGGRAAQDIRILYGGSVKPQNIAALMAMEDIDGALVGGASLEADSFAAIARLGA